MISAFDSNLAEWANKYWSHKLHHPLDRPWYKISPPTQIFISYEEKCHCGHVLVSLVKHKCEDGKSFLYLGQCYRCEAILWSIYDPTTLVK